MGVLVVGVGNPLRRDDGVGTRIAEAIAAEVIPGVTVQSHQQLTPELAETMSLFDHVIVADASTEVPAGRFQIDSLKQDAASTGESHECDLATLAAIAEALYGRRPRFTTVAVGADDLGFGLGFSPAVQSGLPAAVQAVRLLCDAS